MRSGLWRPGPQSLFLLREALLLSSTSIEGICFSALLIETKRGFIISTLIKNYVGAFEPEMRLTGRLPLNVATLSLVKPAYTRIYRFIVYRIPT